MWALPFLEPLIWFMWFKDFGPNLQIHFKKIHSSVKIKSCARNNLNINIFEQGFLDRRNIRPVKLKSLLFFSSFQFFIYSSVFFSLLYFLSLTFTFLRIILIAFFSFLLFPLSPFLAFFWNSLEKHLPQNSRVRNRCFTLPPGIRLCLLVWHIFRDLSLASLLGPFEDNYIKPALDFPFNKLRLSLQKSKEERP